MSGDVLPTVVGIALVAAAAAFALLPLVRHTQPAEPTPPTAPLGTERGQIYRQVLELEFDYRLGKLSQADFQELSASLLARAGALLRDERGTLGELDAEIEREIAAARAAFAAARNSSRSSATPSTEAEPVP